jgi:hypothetical protein
MVVNHMCVRFFNVEICLYSTNNQAHSWLTIAQAVPSSSPYKKIYLGGAACLSGQSCRSSHIAGWPGFKSHFSLLAFVKLNETELCLKRRVVCARSTLAQLGPMLSIFTDFFSI